MKLIRHGAPGAERPGLVAPDGSLRDLSGQVADIAGPALMPAERARLATLDPDSLPRLPEGTRIGPCVGGVGKIVAIGLNYADHAAEAGMEVPPEPMIFMKATSSICGPFDPILIPRGSRHTDWEVELGVCIGKPAKYVSEADALSHVAGYFAANDVSERHFQSKRAGQFTKGKSADHFCPIGPWLVTPDEVADPQDMTLWLTVNGETRQQGTTAPMVYGVRHLVHYLSQFMTLHTGDLILTGTPPGVGMGMNPKQFLRAGDVVELGLHGLGVQRTPVIDDPA